MKNAVEIFESIGSIIAVSTRLRERGFIHEANTLTRLSDGLLEDAVSNGLDLQLDEDLATAQVLKSGAVSLHETEKGTRVWIRQEQHQIDGRNPWLLRIVSRNPNKKPLQGEQ